MLLETISSAHSITFNRKINFYKVILIQLKYTNTLKIGVDDCFYLKLFFACNDSSVNN